MGGWAEEYWFREKESAMNGPDSFLDAARRIEKELKME